MFLIFLNDVLNTCNKKELDFEIHFKQNGYFIVMNDNINTKNDIETIASHLMCQALEDGLSFNIKQRKGKCFIYLSH